MLENLQCICGMNSSSPNLISFFPSPLCSQSFFGIFDGHGGKRAAEFASENMGKFIIEQVSTTSGAGSSAMEEAVRIGYMKTDKEFLKAEMDGGACCVTALLIDGDLIVSNAGDCRAVLSRAGKAEALTSDHRPSRKDERERIENLVSISTSFGSSLLFHSLII